MQTLTHSVEEESTLIIECSFTDEEGEAVTPSSVTWTLTDSAGTIINSRLQESATPGEVSYIALSGDDLALQSTETGCTKVERRLLIEAVYSSTYGTDLPLKRSCRFFIDNLTAV